MACSGFKSVSDTQLLANVTPSVNTPLPLYPTGAKITVTNPTVTGDAFITITPPAPIRTKVAPGSLPAGSSQATNTLPISLGNVGAGSSAGVTLTIPRCRGARLARLMACERNPPFCGCSIGPPASTIKMLLPCGTRAWTTTSEAPVSGVGSIADENSKRTFAVCVLHA